jgi:hypothetical protein
MTFERLVVKNGDTENQFGSQHSSTITGKWFRTICPGGLVLYVRFIGKRLLLGCVLLVPMQATEIQIVTGLTMP